MALFEAKKTEMQPPQQAVIVKYRFASGSLDRIFEVEEQLARIVEATPGCEFDGNEIAVDGRDNLFYMYGPDADKLFEVIEPVLLSSEILSEAQVRLRYGPPGIDTRVKTVTLPVYSTTRH